MFSCFITRPGSLVMFLSELIQVSCHGFRGCLWVWSSKMIATPFNVLRPNTRCVNMHPSVHAFMTLHSSKLAEEHSEKTAVSNGVVRYIHSHSNVIHGHSNVISTEILFSKPLQTSVCSTPQKGLRTPVALTLLSISKYDLFH